MQAPTGHILPVASVAEFVPSPAGMQHGPTRSMPEQIVLVVRALDKPKPQQVDGMMNTVQIRHDQVVSLCDPDERAFRVEALCDMNDIFAYNMSDGKPRYMVGTIRCMEKDFVITVARVFTLEGDGSTLSALHVEEIQALAGLQVRRGEKQKASVLMESTPAKKPYQPSG